MSTGDTPFYTPASMREAGFYSPASEHPVAGGDPLNPGYPRAARNSQSGQTLGQSDAHRGNEGYFSNGYTIGDGEKDVESGRHYNNNILRVHTRDNEKGDKQDGNVHISTVDYHDLGRRKSYVDPSTGRRKSYSHMNEAERVEYLSDRTEAGEVKFHKLGWLQLVVVLIVEAIALGSLSLPAAFHQLGMIGGVVLTVGIGFIAIYTSYVVGQVKLKYPQVQHYSDVGPLLCGPGLAGRIVQWILGIAFVLYLILLVGSHCLTGTIAFSTISESSVCKIVWGVVSTILLFVCAIPPSFAEMAVLGYIDFVSIIAAILITLIATGIQASKLPGGSGSVDWSGAATEKSFGAAMVAVSNIVFAYSFAICQFSFMGEMHTPSDFPKSVWVLGITEIIIYTCTGAIGYAFVGSPIQSPALLSAGRTVSRIAFGVALPVIFISGSINTVTAGRFIMDCFFSKSPIRYVNTGRGWAVWLVMITVISILAFVIAEAIPFFSALLGVISSLFISGFSLYIPGIMWLVLIREGGFFASTKNAVLTIANVLIIAIGLLVLGAGTYGAIEDITKSFADGTVGGSYSC